jgi:hypothetical protein
VNNQEHDAFELQLRRIKPATPPEAFSARLLAAQPRVKTAARPKVTTISREWRGSLLLRWLIPSAAVLIVATLIWRGNLPSVTSSTANAAPVLTADDVKIDQQLVSSFDTVAKLPGGEPVRFRCENWVDRVVLTDKARGVVIEDRKPRMEVVSLGFETY